MTILYIISIYFKALLNVESDSGKIKYIKIATQKRVNAVVKFFIFAIEDIFLYQNRAKLMSLIEV